MNYRHIFYSSIIIFIITSTILVYHIFSPSVSASSPYYSSTSEIKIENLENYFYSQGSSSTLYVLIGSDDDNTTYLQETVLSNLAKECNLTYFDFLIYVSVDNLDETTKQLLEDTYQLTTIPSFISLENIDGEMLVTSSLSWDDSEPIEGSEIKEWMQINNIWPAN